MLDWSSLTAPQLLTAIMTAMYNEEMKNNMENMHRLFRDQKEHPLERAVWWVEYVIRHKGAQFLKPHSMELWWFQNQLWDVILFLSGLLVIVCFILWKCCSCCCRRVICCPREKRKVD